MGCVYKGKWRWCSSTHQGCFRKQSLFFHAECLVSCYFLWWTLFPIRDVRRKIAKPCLDKSMRPGVGRTLIDDALVWCTTLPSTTTKMKNQRRLVVSSVRHPDCWTIVPRRPRFDGIYSVGTKGHPIRSPWIGTEEDVVWIPIVHSRRFALHQEADSVQWGCIKTRKQLVIATITRRQMEMEKEHSPFSTLR